MFSIVLGMDGYSGKNIVFIFTEYRLLWGRYGSSVRVFTRFEEYIVGNRTEWGVSVVGEGGTVGILVKV